MKVEVTVKSLLYLIV